MNTVLGDRLGTMSQTSVAAVRPSASLTVTVMLGEAWTVGVRMRVGLPLESAPTDTPSDGVEEIAVNVSPLVGGTTTPAASST